MRTSHHYRQDAERHYTDAQASAELALDGALTEESIAAAHAAADLQIRLAHLALSLADSISRQGR